MPLVFATFIVVAIVDLAALSALVISAGPVGGVEGYLAFALHPLLACANGILQLVVYRWARSRYPALAVNALFVVAFVALYIFARRHGGWRIDYLLLLAGGLWGLSSLLRRWVPGRAITVLAAVVLAVSGAALLLYAPQPHVAVNDYGLASFAPNRVEEVDFSTNPYKDNYPVCRFRYNSLGYRDIDPVPAAAASTKILLVGDSFVWGDGVPENEQTLGARLRESLGRRAPGRFAVLSAGFPGNGIYGYSVTAERIAARWRPDIVIVAFLGSNELTPYDPQLIVDHMPSSPPLRRLFLNLRIGQRVLEAAELDPRPSLRAKRESGFFAQAFARLAGVAQQRPSRVVLLDYSGKSGAAELQRHQVDDTIEVWELPAEWWYRGTRNELWYARDNHPKPKLNALTADFLAERILEPGAPRAASSPSP